MNDRFHRFARVTSDAIGDPRALIAALVLIGVWALTGPVLGFSDTWQLLINTPTTIVTMLILFPMQHSQNTDTAAIHRKLDEIILKLPQTDDAVAGIEHE
jgi:low affinity Fe/Cu permease